MSPDQLDDALEQVRKLQELVLEKRQFKGYSGVARIISGFAALAAAALLASKRVPATPEVQLLGWGLVLGLALVVNYGALIYWFTIHPPDRNNLTLLRPVFDAVPSLAAGAILSIALILARQFNFLFGVWMMLYGLTHLTCRQFLPRENGWVGLFYLVSGAFCLLMPGISFLNPWPMGITFFAGEVVGGLVFLSYRKRS